MENLGYTPKQYKTTLKKLDQKHAGEKRLLQQYIETILQTSTIWELEIFSDRLVDVVAKLKYYGHHGSFKASQILHDWWHKQNVLGHNSLLDPFLLVRATFLEPRPPVVSRDG